MWSGLLLAALAGGLFLGATPRADGPLRGWRGTGLGLAAALLAVWRLHAAGLGLAESTAQVLAVAMLVLPVLSYLLAARRRAARRAAR